MNISSVSKQFFQSLETTSNETATAVKTTSSSRTDSVEISQSGYDYLAQAHNTSGVEKYSQSELERMLEQSKQSADATAEGISVKMKCLRISVQIMNGHKVTDKDKKFLIENDSDLYMKAEMLRRKNQHAKKIKQISPDEEEDEKTDVSDIREQLANDEIDQAFANASDMAGSDTSAESESTDTESAE